MNYKTKVYIIYFLLIILLVTIWRYFQAKMQSDFLFLIISGIVAIIIFIVMYLLVKIGDQT